MHSRRGRAPAQATVLIGLDRAPYKGSHSYLLVKKLVGVSWVMVRPVAPPVAAAVSSHPSITPFVHPTSFAKGGEKRVETRRDEGKRNHAFPIVVVHHRLRASCPLSFLLSISLFFIPSLRPYSLIHPLVQPTFCRRYTLFSSTSSHDTAC